MAAHSVVQDAEAIVASEKARIVTLTAELCQRVMVDNDRLRADNDRLRRENEWLSGQLVERLRGD